VYQPDPDHRPLAHRDFDVFCPLWDHRGAIARLRAHWFAVVDEGQAHRPVLSWAFLTVNIATSVEIVPSTVSFSIWRLRAILLMKNRRRDYTEVNHAPPERTAQRCAR
jgi:hypothetical protein